MKYGLQNGVYWLENLASGTWPAIHDCLSVVHNQSIMTVKTDGHRICRVQMQFAFPLLYKPHICVYCAKLLDYDVKVATTLEVKS